MPAIRRIELPHSSGVGFAGGIALVVFGNNGRTNTYWLLADDALCGGILYGTPCFSQVLQADSVTNSITI